MFRPEQVGTRKRYTYARAQEVLKMPAIWLNIAIIRVEPIGVI